MFSLYFNTLIPCVCILVEVSKTTVLLSISIPVLDDATIHSLICAKTLFLRINHTQIWHQALKGTKVSKWSSWPKVPQTRRGRE